MGIGGLNLPSSSCLQTLIFEWKSVLNFNPSAKFQTLRHLTPSSLRSVLTPNKALCDLCRPRPTNVRLHLLTVILWPKITKRPSWKTSLKTARDQDSSLENHNCAVRTHVWRIPPPDSSAADRAIAADASPRVHGCTPCLSVQALQQQLLLLPAMCPVMLMNVASLYLRGLTVLTYWEISRRMQSCSFELAQYLSDRHDRGVIRLCALLYLNNQVRSHEPPFPSVYHGLSHGL